MNIFYTYQASHDLRRLHDFIKHKNPQAARETAEKLMQAVERLRVFPLLGKKVKGDDHSSIRDIVTGKYIIRYLALPTEIHILRIWHGREVP